MSFLPGTFDWSPREIAGLIVSLPCQKIWHCTCRDRALCTNGETDQWGSLLLFPSASPCKLLQLSGLFLYMQSHTGSGALHVTEQRVPVPQRVLGRQLVTPPGYWPPSRKSRFAGGKNWKPMSCLLRPASKRHCWNTAWFFISFPGNMPSRGLGSFEATCMFVFTPFTPSLLHT